MRKKRKSLKAKKAAGWIDIPVPESRIDIPEEKPDVRPDLSISEPDLLVSEKGTY